MTTFRMAALIALAATQAAAAQDPVSRPVLQPSVDSAEARQELRKFTMCVAEARPRWAHEILAEPYMSPAQGKLANMAMGGRDTCIVKPESQMTVRISGLVGGIAEYLLRDRVGAMDPKDIALGVSNANARNASEDFALCLAARDVLAARTLTFSEPGSSTETEAADKIARGIRPCSEKGETLVVDLQSLRALTATALYLGVLNSPSRR